MILEENLDKTPQYKRHFDDYINYKIGGCLPAATNIFRRLIKPILLSFRQMIVARPVAVLPPMTLKFSDHSKWFSFGEVFYT